MITFTNVSKSFDKSTWALRDISLTIHANEIFGIVGESGAGKSTLLRIINQLDVQTQGSVSINDTDISLLSEDAIRRERQKIGMVFQQYNLLSNQTVAQNILLPLRLQKQQSEQRVHELLAFVGLTHKHDHYPRELSGGERQRVAIARALASQPEILLCDEPTSALDPKTSHDVINLLQNVNQVFGTTLIIVTHDLSVAKALCHRVAILERGHLAEIVDVRKQAMNVKQSYSTYAKEVLTQ